MHQPTSSVFPISASAEAHDPPPGRARPPLTERVAGWSARHRKTAVFGWMLLVAALFMAGQALGSKNLPQYNAYAETVLIQARTPGATVATDPAMRQAASQVAAALAAQPKYAAGIRTPLSHGGQALVSKDGRSALVTFDVPGNVSKHGHRRDCSVPDPVNTPSPSTRRAGAAQP